MVDVLVVDDNRGFCQLLVSRFELEGYTADMAHDGAEAMEMLNQEGNYQLIIMDILMPGMDGTSFLNMYKGKIPVMIMTNLEQATYTNQVKVVVKKETASIEDIVREAKPFLGGI